MIQQKGMVSEYETNTKPTLISLCKLSSVSQKYLSEEYTHY